MNTSPLLHALARLHIHHLLAIGHHAVSWVRLEFSNDLSHRIACNALLMAHRAVFVGKQKRFEVDYLFSKLGTLRGQSVVLGCENLNLGL